MNKLLKLDLQWHSAKHKRFLNTKNFTKNRFVDATKLKTFINQLNNIVSFYHTKQTYIKSMLIDVYYDDLIAKSSRISELFKEKRGSNDSILGARFSSSDENKKHIITYYVSQEVVDIAIRKIMSALKFINDKLNGLANKANYGSNIQFDYSDYEFPKSIRDIIMDCSVIEKFALPHMNTIKDKDFYLITFFNTELDISDLFLKLKIPHYNYTYIDKNTYSVTKETLEVIEKEVPFLVSMVSGDIAEISSRDFENKKENKFIPHPSNEPIIGVIDTMFDTTVYFHEWVDYREEISEFEHLDLNSKDDYTRHGTSITSLIVDGPTLNPWLNDNCGRFRVRHFGVCFKKITLTRLAIKIEQIVKNNLDIHVWNLSLGSNEEISENFISYIAYLIDKLENQFNVIFVIAGTNDDTERVEKNNKYIKIGSPADSLNSIVVNSVRKDGSPVSYARSGRVLSFFNKPDVSFYGGDLNEQLNVYSSFGLEKMHGTSLASPWIARKMAYMIDILGLPREAAKALIIDSAAGWDYKKSAYQNQNIVGYGVVPIKIEDVINSNNSEIKFILYNSAKGFKTYNYGIPVPKNNDNTSSYIARATLCYFPMCNRNEGVDYTQEELSIRFGRTTNEKILDINFNTENREDCYATEKKSRNEFRKWENTKFISSLLRTKYAQKTKLYNEGFWGVEIVHMMRGEAKNRPELNFGLVVTLKNINGENRINDFIYSCRLHGYIVSEIDIENILNIHNKLHEEIVFD